MLPKCISSRSSGVTGSASKPRPSHASLGPYLTHCMQILLVHLLPEKIGKAFLHARQFRQHGRRRFLRFLDECGRIEISLGVVDGEHKGRFTIPHLYIAHSRGTSALFAFYVEM